MAAANSLRSQPGALAWCQIGRVIDCLDADLHGEVAPAGVAYLVNPVGDRTAGHQKFAVSTFVTI